ncbi:MAG: Hsp20/alpha crystallin family protein [Candidatus Margulisbacteria bacterium]|nr:Hsp20/alpha crystallin family protein [Candidatus Margulisiibacteriota bacterium]
MALVPFPKSSSLMDVLEDNFERALGPVWSSVYGLRPAKELFAPSIDMWEDEDNIYVETDLPGMEKNDVKVSVEKGILKISAKKEGKKEEKKKGYIARERYQGSFYKEISLPSSVEENKIQANLKNGILSINLPKKEEAKGKEIEVKVD